MFSVIFQDKMSFIAKITQKWPSLIGVVYKYSTIELSTKKFNYQI